MDDPGFQDSDRDERPTGGLTRRFLVAMRISLLAGCVLLLIRYLANDRFLLTEWIGHIHPLFWAPLLLLVPLAWMPRWMGIIAFLLVSTLIGLQLHREQPNLLRLHDPAPATMGDDIIRLSFWNVMSFNRGKDAVANGFLADDADIVCLVEGTYQGQVHDSLSRALGSDYQWVSVRQMAVGSRFPILRSRELPTRTRLRVFEVRVLTPDGPVGVIVGDMPSPPRLDTRGMLLELGALLATVERPFLLVGDLNTARGSWRLERATSDLRDFYREVSPARWHGSWPDALPIWQIDHAFAGPGVRPAFADLRGRGDSNHLRVSIGFSLEDSALHTHDQAFAPEPNQPPSIVPRAPNSESRTPNTELP